VTDALGTDALGTDAPEGPRAAELAGAMAALERRLVAACASAGRGRHEVTLVAVSKTRPASDAALLVALGQRDLGESRDQEAAPKALTLAAAGTDVVWHFVGRLQRNKARSVASYSAVVHSLDRVALAAPLVRGAADAGRTPPVVLVQVSLDGDPARGGVRPADVAALAGAAADAGLDVRGVMAVAPLGQAPRTAFARLAAVAADLRREHPAATWISAGMSGDLEAAIAEGATHVRVGTALFGSRPPVSH